MFNLSPLGFAPKFRNHRNLRINVSVSSSQTFREISYNFGRGSRRFPKISQDPTEVLNNSRTVPLENCVVDFY